MSTESYNRAQTAWDKWSKELPTNNPTIRRISREAFLAGYLAAIIEAQKANGRV